MPDSARSSCWKNSIYLLTIVNDAVLTTAPAEAVIVTTVFLFVAAVLILKLADVFPARIVTVDGTVALGLLLDKFTTKPPLGAIAVSVTVPTDPTPPRTVVGLSVNDASAAGAGGLTVSVADPVTPL